MIDPVTGAVSWTPTAADIGTVAAALAATDPLGAAAVQSFLVDVRAANGAPVVAGAAPATVPRGGQYRYDVRAADPDREPLFSALTDAPAGMSIDVVGRVRWQTTLDTPLGTRGVTVRVADGRSGVVTQSFTLNVVPDTTAPRVSVIAASYGGALFPWSAEPARVRVSATDDVGVTGLRVLVDGRPVPMRADNSFDVPYSGPGNGRIEAFATDAAAGNEGRGVLRITMRSGAEGGSGNQANAPTASIDSIAEGGQVGGFVRVVGTASSPDLASYALSYRRADRTAFTPIAAGTAPVSAASLGVWDTTLLENGGYVLKLEATDAFGGFAAVERAVGVSGDFTLGNFRLSFNDTTVPVVGLPVTVARTYDTLSAGTPGDFGYGWRLEYRDARLQTSLPKSGLEGVGVCAPFKPGVKVHVTLPGGRREGFTFTPESRTLAGFGGPGLTLATPRFTADRGVRDTLSARGGTLLVNEAGELMAAGGVPWNPASPDFGGGYTLTTPEGTRYQIDGTRGLLATATDRNGTTLTFTDAGVTGPGGAAVAFERDAKGPRHGGDRPRRPQRALRLQRRRRPD